ncbi:hypothetical protein [Phenylobacterium sp.]|uniref:hypothetical protein n=1 Tax=Phenylobacterium sp. TaxID=1871053 RepID=UPI002DF0298A|nr:hypothetical protein [Phenylobacterium sp.]
MRNAIKAGGAYFAVVFPVAFLVGMVRVLFAAPRLGALVAVALEIPLILALSWIACGYILRRIPVRGRGGRLAMGGFAFLVLMVAEAALDLALGRTLAAHFAAMGEPAGLLGLAGQAAFGLAPLVRR